jgi:hypothetical protein
MEGQTIQWKDRQYNGRADNTMEGQTIQWKGRQYNGRADNTIAKKKKDKREKQRSTKHCTEN